MIKPDLIIRTNRRSMSLSISSEGQVIIRAPRKLSMDRILSFVNEKEGWINKHLQNLEKQKKSNFDIKTYEAFLILGKKYEVRQIAGIKKIEVCKEEIIYPVEWTKEKLVQKMKKYYLDLANKVLAERLEYFANLMQINYTAFYVKNFKSRWGSCDNKYNITLNYKSIMLPHKIVDYILIHELSHILEFNHSTRFYKIIECVMPDYKTYRKQLKDYNYLLKI